MKHFIVIGIVGLMLLSACTQTLPDEPPLPGESVQADILGQATGTQLANWFSSRNVMTVLPNPLVFERQNQLIGTEYEVLFVSNQDTAIFNRGYVSLGGGRWNSFNMQGQTLGGNWLRDSATAEVPVRLADVRRASNEEVVENNYVLTYTCTLRANAWDCHQGRWQIQQFTIITPTCEKGCDADGFCLAVGEVNRQGTHICAPDGNLLALPGSPAAPGTTGEIPPSFDDEFVPNPSPGDTANPPSNSSYSYDEEMKN